MALPSNIREEAVKRYRSGIAAKQVARDLDIDYAQMASLAKRYPRGPRPRTTKSKILSLYGKGVPAKVIALKLGIPHKDVLHVTQQFPRRMHSQGKGSSVTIYLHREHLAALDKVRGHIPRSTIIRKLVERAAKNYRWPEPVDYVRNVGNAD